MRTYTPVCTSVDFRGKGLQGSYGKGGYGKADRGTAEGVDGGEGEGRAAVCEKCTWGEEHVGSCEGTGSGFGADEGW